MTSPVIFYKLQMNKLQMNQVQLWKAPWSIINWNEKSMEHSLKVSPFVFL